MEFNEYQSLCFKTAKYHDAPIEGHVYCSLKLAGEAGEVAEKVGKVYRDEAGKFTTEKKQELAKELGDVLWYVANLAGLWGFKLEDIAQMNVDKLFDRLERGVIAGSGDNR